MDKEESYFLSPGDPIIIVRKMTQKVIEQAIEAYPENDAYWLKFYHLKYFFIFVFCLLVIVDE
jgi:hypothetical protein